MGGTTLWCGPSGLAVSWSGEERQDTGLVHVGGGLVGERLLSYQSLVSLCVRGLDCEVHGGLPPGAERETLSVGTEWASQGAEQGPRGLGVPGTVVRSKAVLPCGVMNRLDRWPAQGWAFPG